MQKRDEFVIGHVGGFMLKHIRANTPITEFADEFRYIRHGHYDTLIETVQKRFPGNQFRSPIQVGYFNGEITTNNFTQRNHCDFVGIMNSQKPLNEFSKLLLAKYPIIKDPEFETRVFQEVILFELSIRNNLSNQYLNRGWNHNELTDTKIDLEPAINKLCELKEFNSDIKELFHTARQFRNYVVKQKLGPTYNFKTGEEGLLKFRQAIKTGQENEIGLYID